MAYQAAINNGNVEKPAAAMGRGMADFAADLTELAELQSRLFVEDSREATRQIAWPAAMLVAGLVVALGCAPMALIAFAVVLVQHGGMTHSAACGLALAFGILLASGLLFFGGKQFAGALHPFDRSKAELKENVVWVRDSLRQSRR